MFAFADNQTDNNTEENMTFDNVTVEENVTVNDTPDQNVIANETPDDPPQDPLATVTTLLLNRVDLINGELFSLEASLFADDAPVSDEEISFYLDYDLIGSGMTNEEGIASYDWEVDAGAGSFLLEAEYAGSDAFYDSSDAEAITVEDEALEPLEDRIEYIPDDRPALPQNVERVEDCHEVESISYEDVYDTCEEVVCDALLNESCEQDVVVEYQCHIGRRTVRHISNQCTVNAYQVDNIQVNTAEYSCSFSVEDENTVMICDSIYDGNGDGVCQSGETCQKFFINGQNVQSLERNSDDEFREWDPSFFMERATTEVIT